MSRTRKLAALIVGLVVSLTAWGAAKADIPISITTPVTLSVRMSGSAGSGTMGALPLTVAFDFDSASCSGSISGTASLVNGRLRLRMSGSVDGGTGPCSASVEVQDYDYSFDVPDLGEATTPVVFSLERTAGHLTGPRAASVYATTGGNFSSNLIGGEVYLCEGSASCIFSLYVVTEGSRRSARIVDMIPGDSVVSGTGFVSNKTELQTPSLTIGDTFDETAEFYVDLPPDVQQTAIPPQVGWLVGGVLIGLGVKMSRRKVRGAS
jgi:hypothetical protein